MGPNVNRSVCASLLCGTVRHDSALVPLGADGDFRIEGTLTPAGVVPCDNPVLLIVSGNARRFAAGIPKR